MHKAREAIDGMDVKHITNESWERLTEDLHVPVAYEYDGTSSLNPSSNIIAVKGRVCIHTGTSHVTISVNVDKKRFEFA